MVELLEKYKLTIGLAFPDELMSPHGVKFTELFNSVPDVSMFDTHE